MARILGIDPGLHITGWGAVDYDGYHLKYVAHGVIKTDPAIEIERRLGDIYRGLSDVIEKVAPQEVSVEQVFVNNNPASSLKLGMARGVVLCVANIMGLKTFGYPPNAIKKSVVGSGHATKEQSSSMVRKLLNCGEVKHDAADALSAAICHAHHSQLYRLVI
ncbi:MAG: crossover junction endodeoxyribonuclease RuvC [Holosporaceae bacterium]|jgi:crossover junction endodeoxyribonuclease RuvC|nr:crossover junction endodeoxyribonuclease RuvC [Holosporaceae bacterium]